MQASSFALILLSATTTLADKVDDLVNAEMKKAKIPGLSLAIIRDGKPIKLKGYGFANLEHNVPVRPETIFQSGSVGKQFTSTLVMMLVEEGKVSLDDSVSKHIKEAAGKWDNVTVRHLLSHTSGLPDLPYGQMDLTRDYKEEDLLKLMLDQKIPKEPGTEWRYNNGGYVMLGVLVRRVTGKFYGDMLQEKIFKPLGMTTARNISEEDIVPHRAAGYVPNQKGELKNQYWVAPTLNTTADGSLYLNLHDMVKWDAALYGEKLLKKSSLEQMWTPITLNDGKEGGMRGAGYGFGWMIAKPGGHRYIQHGGAWQGFTSFIGRVVDQKLTVVMFANRAGAPVEVLSRRVLALYIPTMAPAPVTGK